MKTLTALVLLCLSTWAIAQTTVSVGTTVVNANAQRGGMNLGSFDYYYDIGYKNFLATYGRPGFEPFQSRQIFQVEDDQNRLGSNLGIYSTTQVQANLNNLDYDGAPLNFYATNSAVLTVEQSSGSEAGCSRTVTASTQASHVFLANIQSISGTSGTITVNLTTPFTNGSLASIGQTIGVRINGISGGTGTLNGVFTAVVTGSNSFTYTSTGANATGASISSATASSGNGVMYSWASPCSAPLQPGDIFSLTFTQNTASNLGSFVSASGGATVTAQSADVCSVSQTIDPATGATALGTGSGCGTQTLKCDSTGGGSCTVRYYLDTSTAQQNFALLNGNYLTSFMSKAASGTPSISVHVYRNPSTGTDYTFTPTLTGTWTQETDIHALSETTTTSNLGQLWIDITMSGSGIQYLDNVFWGPATSSSSSNKTQFRDELVNTLIALKPGTLRYWAGGGQNAQTMANWVQPMFTQFTSEAGLNNVYGGGSVQYSLPDFLKLCQTVGTTPHIVIPLTSTITDVQNFTDYLFGSSATTYGSVRIALGGPSAAGGWATVFPTIYGELGNENWNMPSELGQGLGFRGSVSAPYDDPSYLDYGAWATTRFAAIRAMSSYNSALKLLVGTKTAGTGSDSATIASISKADGVAINGYYANNINTTSPTLAFYQPVLTETWSNTHDPNSASGFDQQWTAINSSSGCSASGSATCQTVVYEENFGTGSSGCNQACLDALVDAGVGAFTAADQTLENVDAGINSQDMFVLSQYSFTENTFNPHMWGAVIDMGGQLSKLNTATFGGSYTPRPTFLGLQLANGCIIGPQLGTGSTNNIFYSLGSNSNGVTPVSNVPTIRYYAFKNGPNVCLALLNADTSTSYPVTFGGTNAPQGTVSKVQIAPPSLSSLNEATAGNATNNVTATVYPVTSTLTSFTPSTSITLPPYSVTTLTYLASTVTAATPTFSPAAGTYSSAQSVTISDATSGSTIYYTTDGSTPTSASTVYTGAITVDISKTVKAIATAAGYIDSAVGSAAYTITQLPPPTFAPGGGSYNNNQTVAMTDAVAGTSIYYTLNGTTPTTSSTLYTAPRLISNTATIQAIAVKSGYTNSNVSSATYTLIKADPVILPAAGTYPGPLTVTMSDVTTSGYIAYTTNGGAIVSMSPHYSSPITISTSSTVKAQGIATGYTASAVVNNVYTILPYAATPTFSPAAGTYTSVQSVTISSSTSGSTIYYTTDGSTPTTSSSVYSGAVSVSTSETLSAIAVKSGYSNSAVGTAAYTINLTAPAPTFSPVAGTYTGAQSISLSVVGGWDTICFTTDGSTPVYSPSTGCNAFFYTSPINVYSSETIKAITVKSGYANSSVASAAYIIQ